MNELGLLSLRIVHVEARISEYNAIRFCNARRWGVRSVGFGPYVSMLDNQVRIYYKQLVRLRQRQNGLRR